MKKYVRIGGESYSIDTAEETAVALDALRAAGLTEAAVRRGR